LFLSATLLAACADVPKAPAEKAEFEATDDPLEPMNRTVFDVNDFLDRLLLRPLAELYRVMIPPGLRDRVAGIVTNMKEPVVFANNVLQGEFGKAGTTLERFSLNTTLGGAGMWDVATGWGLQQQTGDFGQTLSSWGINQGPYLVLPLFGPSNFRDAIGLGVDTVMSPWGYIASIGGHGTEMRFDISSMAADGIVRREQNIEPMDALRSGSLDFYAQMRSVYRQYRDKQLGTTPTVGMPKFDDFE
ncbi:MAG: VacJ family lipoprotein, partial [Alphaproteobacteria bacterium]|nr:VacJ family lipoprotein [Alphaproteobacteria bacterium]